MKDITEDLELVATKVNDLYINCNNYGISIIEHKLFMILGDIETIKTNINKNEKQKSR